MKDKGANPTSQSSVPNPYGIRDAGAQGTYNFLVKKK